MMKLCIYIVLVQKQILGPSVTASDHTSSVVFVYQPDKECSRLIEGGTQMICEYAVCVVGGMELRRLLAVTQYRQREGGSEAGSCTTYDQYPPTDDWRTHARDAASCDYFGQSADDSRR